MPLPAILLLVLFSSCWLAGPAYAQLLVRGVVQDADSKVALPFASIRLNRPNIGTTARRDGSFTLVIPQQYALDTDTLTLSRVGYDDLRVGLSTLRASQPQEFLLQAHPVELASAAVTAVKPVERAFGISRRTTLIHFTDGSVDQHHDSVEIAQLIQPDARVVEITAVNLYIAESRQDSGTFRINFYGFDGRRPTAKTTGQSLLQTVAIREGWLRFDLAKLAIRLKGPFVVGITFLPAPQARTPVSYEVKLGGTAKSFARTGSRADWHIPPHHYLLYVTALVAGSTKNTARADVEASESSPTTRLYAEAVRDSFSLFIRLPQRYKSTGRRYPTVFLLDANAYFDIIADEVRTRKGLADLIIVGIGYKDFVQMDSLRQRDYTYPVADTADSLAVSGGGDRFLSFLEKELIPYMDRRYRTDTTNRVLAGHSLGGYLTLYALLNDIRSHTTCFSGYVAASPSASYHHQHLLRELNQLPADSGRRSVYLTAGSREVSAESPEETADATSSCALVTGLAARNPQNLQVKQVVYPRYDHMETAVPSFIDGLIWLLRAP